MVFIGDGDAEVIGETIGETVGTGWALAAIVVAAPATQAPASKIAANHRFMEIRPPSTVVTSPDALVPERSPALNSAALPPAVYAA